ncbi:MAG: hypothetical protein ABR970_18115 [Roseiarcus sp.]|jgi:hypothetical protein
MLSLAGASRARTAATLILLILTALAAFAPGAAAAQPASHCPAAAALETIATRSAQAAHWPATSVVARCTGKVDSADIAAEIDAVVAALATVNRGAGGALEVRRLASDPDFAALRARLADTFRSSGLIEAGDTIVEVTWRIAGLPPFQTLATSAPSAQPKFEPVLYFDGVATIGAPTTHHSVITTSGLTYQVKNKLGNLCIASEWDVTIQTNNACGIVDPPSHARKIMCRSACWTWEAECAKGEAPYVGAPSRACPGGPQCIKYVLETAWASGTKAVEVELGASGSSNGIALDAKIKFTPGRIGAADENEIVGSLCANGASVVNGRPIPLTVVAAPASPPAAEIEPLGGNFPPTCCRCTRREMTDAEAVRLGCPDRVFASVAEGTSIGVCQSNAIRNAPAACRAFMKHCGWVDPRRCER